MTCCQVARSILWIIAARTIPALFTSPLMSPNSSKANFTSFPGKSGSGHIPHDGAGIATDLFGGFLDAVLVQIVHHDLGAQLCRQRRHTAADTLSGACDDNHLIVQCHRVDHFCLL